jgi:hypothetical protein
MPVAVAGRITNVMKKGTRFGSYPPTLRYTQGADCSLKLTFDLQVPCIGFKVAITRRIPAFAENAPKRPKTGQKWAIATMVIEPRHSNTCLLSCAFDIQIPCFPMWMRVYTGEALQYKDVVMPRPQPSMVKIIKGIVVSLKTLHYQRWTHMYTHMVVARNEANLDDKRDFPYRTMCTVFYRYTNTPVIRTKKRYTFTLQTAKHERGVMTRNFSPIVYKPPRQAQNKAANWTQLKANTFKYSVLFTIIPTKEPTCNVQFKLSVYAPCVPFCLYYWHRSVKCPTFKIAGVQRYEPREYAKHKIFKTRRLAKKNPLKLINSPGHTWHLPVFTFAMTMRAANTCAMTLYFDFAIPCFPVTMVYNRKPQHVVTFDNKLFPRLTVPLRTFYVTSNCTFKCSMFIGFPMGIPEGCCTLVRAVKWQNDELRCYYDVVYFRRGVAISHCQARNQYYIVFKAARC